MRALTALTKALADESRLRILGSLQGGELCVCQIVELLRLAPSTVSKHLTQLRQAGLVDARKEGRWVYYRLAGRGAPRTVRRALALVAEGLDRDATAAADAARLERILALDPEVLCGRQRSASPASLRRGRTE